MQTKSNQEFTREHRGARQTRLPWRPHWIQTMAGLALLVTLVCGAQSINPDKPIHNPVLTAPPDANAQMRMRDEQVKKQNFDAANAERKKQLADDSARLLKLATDLKAEVDKTTKDTLSLTVIRKADEIERLAHNVKEKMKLTMGAN
jgi:hypothetical protein